MPSGILHVPACRPPALLCEHFLSNAFKVRCADRSEVGSPSLHLVITIAGLAQPLTQTHVPWHTAYASQSERLCSVFLPTSVPPEHVFKPKPQWPPSVLAIYRQVTSLGRGQLFCISTNSLHSRDRSTDSCASALSSPLATWTKVLSTVLAAGWSRCVRDFLS